jgi:O-antigen ligase
MARLCELIVTGTACLAPWAFGSVDAWADLLLTIFVALLAACCVFLAWKRCEPARLLNVPGLAIGGLALLAWIQTVPIPAAAYERLNPGGYARLKEWVPTTAQQKVRGDDGPPTAPPVLTLSQDRDETLRPAVQLTAAFVLFECIVSLGGGVQTLRRFGLAVTLNACALTLFALIQALTWKGKIYGIRQSPIPEAWFSGGPFVSYHHLAAYLNFGLGFALAFALGGSPVLARPSSRKHQFLGYRFSPLALYATGLIVVGVVASHSRGGFLAMLASGAVVALALRRQPPRAWIAMIVVLLVAGLFLIAIGTQSPLERLSTIWETSQNGFNGRSEIWSASLRAWLANPVFGLGLGSFPAGAAPYYRFEREALFFHAENDYLEVLAEGGVVGFALGIVALAWIVRLSQRAYATASTNADKLIVMGGIFGLVALAVKSSADFPLHIPGVAITGLVLCAYLTRIGLDDPERLAQLTPGSTWARSAVTRLATFALLLLCGPLIWQCYRRACDEMAIARANIPAPGTQWLTTDYGSLSIPELEKIEVTLEKILKDRPDWTDGHLRLGLMYLSHYERTTAEWAEAAGQNPSIALQAADPLRLHWLIHSEAKSDAAINKFIEEDPVWLFLVPAAKSFLEARRSCPVRALSHAWLGGLDYLIESGEPTSVHISRALAQSGNDIRIMTLCARIALQAGDQRLAARCWRRLLEVRPTRGDDIALVAAAALTPEQILNDVLPPNGLLTIRFADLIYADSVSKSSRVLFLNAAIERAENDLSLSPSERIWCIGQARARLDEPEAARKLMAGALAEEPTREDWRDDYVNWLIRWGDTDEAFNQALIGVNLLPSHSGPQGTLDRATQARARKREEAKTSS